MKRNILVTGSHRSGSTWAGKVISKADNVRYIHEPFNVNGIQKASPFTFWFENLNNAISPARKKQVTNYLDSFFLLFHTDNFKKIAAIKTASSFYHYLVDLKNRVTKRTVIKDPIALMSAEWLYENMHWDVVVLVRHPAAFIASLKVKDWQFDFNHFLKQEHLMNTYLKNYAGEIAAYAADKKPMIYQGILLWNIMHTTISQYQEKFKDKWYFIKHEDLSTDPMAEFEKIFAFLHLSFNKKVKEYISRSTTAKDDGEWSRNSKENIKSWKKRLTEEEIDRIKENTKPVWTHFYSEEDW